MMKYHLRRNDADEIEKLIPIFDNEKPGVYDSPELAAEVFSGLGKFRLAGGDVKEARRFIDLAIAADSHAPETSYIDALYWRVAGDTHREMDAYKRTLVNLEGRESLTRQNLKIRILTLGGMGRVQGLSGDISDAAGSYSKAINLYEDAREKKQLGAGPEFGQLYLDMGNIMYQGTEYSSSAADLRLSLADRPESLDKGSERYSELLLAERFFSEAESLSDRDGFGSGLPPESLYRRAYARYELGRNDALLDFHRVARLKPDDYEVRMALAAVLLESGDFEASRSQYARALDLLDEELRRTGGILNPLDKQSHAELLLRYIIAWNNLGVGRARSAARGGGGEDYAAALGGFTMASEYYEEVYTDMPDLISRGATAVRDPDDRRITREDSGRRVLEETMTLPYLNRMRLLGLESAGEGEDSYLMYPDIPSDLRVK
jgi:tetratricopeptide (TPR) repeat protein